MSVGGVGDNKFLLSLSQLSVRGMHSAYCRAPHFDKKDECAE